MLIAKYMERGREGEGKGVSKKGKGRKEMGDCSRQIFRKISTQITR